jgi:hypothetical protein
MDLNKFSMTDNPLAAPYNSITLSTATTINPPKLNIMICLKSLQLATTGFAAASGVRCLLPAVRTRQRHMTNLHGFEQADHCQQASPHDDQSNKADQAHDE